MNEPGVEPVELVAGDSWSWRRDLAAYPPSAGWSLGYALRGRAGSLDLVGVADGNGYVISRAAADTAAVPPGVYEWAAFVTRGAERFTIGGGRLTVRADLAGMTGGAHDERSYWEGLRDACRAILQKKATNDQHAVEFAGRKLERYSMAEILQLHEKAVREIERARLRDDLAAGIGRPNKVVTRFYR